MFSKRFKKIQIAALLITSLSGLFVGCSNNGNINNFVNNIKSEIGIQTNDNNLNKSVEKLISEIEIKDGSESSYNRNDYTSKYQKYMYNGKKYTSIRSYAYYASVWYDSKTNTYTDPYTNTKINSVKKTDYDHIIPLHYANLHGADKWTNEKKKEYADNPKVGIDVNSHDNRAKGDKGPSEWLPKENVDDYCYTWLVIADEYDLSIDKKDMDVIKSKLNGVPESELQVINMYNN